MNEVLERGKRIADELVPRSYNLGVSEYYLQSDIHKLLGEAVETSGQLVNGNGWIDGMDRDHYNEQTTHTGYLIGIKPIRKESEERKLLSEAAAYLARNYPLMPHPDDEKYREDIARKINNLLLEKQK